jgi:hypothetical protein
MRKKYYFHLTIDSMQMVGRRFLGEIDHNRDILQQKAKFGAKAKKV